MNLLEAHIRVLRAEADAMERQANEVNARAPGHGTVHILLRFADAKREAAAELEGELPKVRENVAIHYDPKGKR